jgi:hypothetical protein
MCLAIKDGGDPGEVILKHLHDDVQVTLGFEGKRGQDDLAPQPPPISKDAFIVLMREWMSAIKASKQWPASPLCGCLLATAIAAGKEVPLQAELEKARKLAESSLKLRQEAVAAGKARAE